MKNDNDNNDDNVNNIKDRTAIVADDILCQNNNFDTTVMSDIVIFNENDVSNNDVTISTPSLPTAMY